MRTTITKKEILEEKSEADLRVEERKGDSHNLPDVLYLLHPLYLLGVLSMPFLLYLLDVLYLLHLPYLFGVLYLLDLHCLPEVLASLRLLLLLLLFSCYGRIHVIF